MSSSARHDIAILGDGGWGTALAVHFHRRGHRVRWWGAFPAYLREVARRRLNRKYLPGVRIPRGIRIEPSLAAAVSDADLIILAVPSQYLRTIARRLRPLRDAWSRAILVSAAKGLEHGTLRRMSQVLEDELHPSRLAVLSGPSIALDVAQGQATTAVVASRTPATAAAIQRWGMDNRLRLYISTDVAGVELGGALKNPLAIAAGISDGLGLGSNAKAALITRGTVEMARLGVALGARAATFWGLSGLGDLITTCLSGRNHWLGVQLGRGRSLRAVLASTPMVIEGVETTRAAVALARRRKVEVPILEQVHAVLFRSRSPRRALHALMVRAGRAE